MAALANAASYPSLAGRIAFVSGGGSGIGAFIVTRLAQQGCKVAFCDVADAASQALVAKLAPAAVRYHRCDVRDIAALRAVLVAIEKEWGPIAVLVNNAARDDRHPLESVTPEYWDDALAVNLRHHFFAAQAVAPGMARAGGGSVINLGSVSWMRGIPLLEAYASAKAAIVGFTNTLARALGPHRIRVNAIAPGTVLTERQRQLWFQTEAQVEAARAAQCLPDLIAPEDIANLALFLASDDSRLITKQTISVNAGVL